MEKISYLGFPNCYKLTNGTIEVVVTTDVGPRVIKYAFAGRENVFGESAKSATKAATDEWRILGGHRLWHAPEVKPRTYAPDNDPVQFTAENGGIRLIQNTEQHTGIQKQMIVTPDATGSGVTIRHVLTNHNVWAVTLAAWGLNVMRGGGTTIVPNEPFVAHGETFLPARPLVIWPFTNMADSRFTWGRKYIRLKTDDKIQGNAQKFGCLNKQGWAGYLREGTLFVARFGHEESKTYPDYGCNFETFTAGGFMEVETLGPLTTLEPGQSLEHVERWSLFAGVHAGDSEEQLDAALKPLLAQLI